MCVRTEVASADVERSVSHLLCVDNRQLIDGPEQLLCAAGVIALIGLHHNVITASQPAAAAGMEIRRSTTASLGFVKIRRETTESPYTMRFESAF